MNFDEVVREIIEGHGSRVITKLPAEIDAAPARNIIALLKGNNVAFEELSGG